MPSDGKSSLGLWSGELKNNNSYVDNFNLFELK